MHITYIVPLNIFNIDTKGVEMVVQQNDVELKPGKLSILL